MSRCMGMALSTPQDKSSLNANGHSKPSLISRLRKRFNFSSSSKAEKAEKNNGTPKTASPANTAPTSPIPANATRRTGRRSVVPELPRHPTLQRQLSEKRDRLRPYEQPHTERRALSSDRRAAAGPGGARASSRSLQPIQSASITSLSELQEIHAQEAAARRANEVPTIKESQKVEELKLEEIEAPQESGELVSYTGPTASPISTISPISPISPTRPMSGTFSGPRDSIPQILAADEEGLSNLDEDEWSASKLALNPRIIPREIEEEMEWRWILNLSMHFRDESNREKFFVTYAQERNSRRRLTISCDYRDAEEGTLEKELSGLKYQRDKSAKIYEAIRDSLQDIMFYDTITNLKLKTSEGRLHVHVTEDLNEIISFPPVMAIAHLRCPKYRECDLEFDSHLSGFVYKVGVKGEIMIKKEIPGPDTVDEFLYEINALYALADSENVIQFGGCVVDDRRERVKGLLISFAPKGALIDIVFNEKGRLPWAIREKWAKQIVSGLSEIHEAGYVQGDFTLSNIVIDDKDNAKIIDINRRGCPVGWEPPEVTAMIDGLQRIGMYIGVKSDLFQLGMVLWGLAFEDDEPEGTQRPLAMDHAPDDVPAYFRNIVEACLCDRPQGRPSAKDIIGMFPERIDDEPHIVNSRRYDGQPLPAIMQWGETAAETDSTLAGDIRRPSTGPRGMLLNGENLESLSQPPSLQPLSRQREPSEPSEPPSFHHLDDPPPPSIPTDTDDDDIPQVIEAAPSNFSSDAELAAIPAHMLSSLSSSIGGGVDLETSSTRPGSGATEVPSLHNDRKAFSMGIAMLPSPPPQNGFPIPPPPPPPELDSSNSDRAGTGTPNTTKEMRFMDAKEVQTPLERSCSVSVKTEPS